MNSKMPAPTSWGVRLPRQVQRSLPVYIAIIIIILFYSFESSVNSENGVLKRVGKTVLSYPYQRKTPLVAAEFPKKIWQTWKVDPLDFEERDSVRARSWPQKNPGYRYEVLTDGNDLHYVELNFGPEGLNRPDIVNMYRDLSARIIKADLLRYLVMYVEGGVYADIDVEAIRPIDQFIPPQFNASDVGLVISVEIDEPNYANHTILGPKSQSFCQWTFMCRPRLPIMMRLIDHVVGWLNSVALKQQVPIANITLNFDDVLTGTGPSAFTQIMWDEIKAQTGSVPPWSEFHNMENPKLFGDILVLTVDSFAAGQGHSNSGNHDSPRAMVRHHYHASLWPSRHPRYSHPAFGMVEECNWKPECVAKWDENFARWDSLPDDEKANLIEIKRIADAEKYDKEQREEAEKKQKEEDERIASLQTVCATIPTPTPTTLSSGPPTVTAAPGEGEKKKD